MGGSTFAIGLVPSYEAIGVFAPLLVLLLRLAQGLALGGEYGGAATYVAEYAPVDKRGFYTSFIQTTATLGLFVSLGVILLVRNYIGVDAFASWGWRIPFLLSAVLVGVSIFIRLRMQESPLFTKIKAEGKLSKNPIKESFGNKENLKLVLLALFGATAGQGVVFYTGQFYALSFLQKNCMVEFSQSYYIMVVALLLGTPLFIVFGAWSDKVGRKYIMMIGLIAAALLYRPIYRQMFKLTNIELKTQMDGSEQITKTTSYTDAGDTVKVTKRIATFTDGCILTASSKVVTGVKIKQALSESKKEVSLGTTNFIYMAALIFIQLILVAMVYGPIAAFLVELFPTKIRYTSMSLPYHIGNGVFGGLTPFLATSLFEYSKSETLPKGDPFAGLWYPIVVASVCFVIGMLYLSNKKKVDVKD